MKIPDDVIEQLFSNPRDTFTWSEWKEMLPHVGVQLVSDEDSEYTDDSPLTSEEAQTELEKCKIKILGQEPEPKIVILEEQPKTPESEAIVQRIKEHARPDGYTSDGKLIEPKMVTIKPVVMQGPRIVVPVAPKKLTVPEWRREFQKLMDHPPCDGVFLGTEDGSPVKLEIELYEGRPPFIFTRVYVPMIVGAPLGWFAQGAGNSSSYGCKTLLLPKSRDEAVKKLGLASSFGFVQTIRVIKKAETGKSLLAEVVEWI